MKSRSWACFLLLTLKRMATALHEDDGWWRLLRTGSPVIRRRTLPDLPQDSLEEKAGRDGIRHDHWAVFGHYVLHSPFRMRLCMTANRGIRFLWSFRLQSGPISLPAKSEEERQSAAPPLAHMTAMRKYSRCHYGIAISYARNASGQAD